MTAHHLAAAELHIRIAREQHHAAHAMAELSRLSPSDRVRRPGHGTERSTARAWRRVRRHLRRAALAAAHLAQLGGAK